MSKKLMLLLVILSNSYIIFSQNNIETIYSSIGIKVSTISPSSTQNRYNVIFFNENNCVDKNKIKYCFEWYLSYKGNKVSDVYQETIMCGDYLSRDVYCWPDEVPNGYEKYVTVQIIKKESRIKSNGKDSRDDD